MSLALPDLVAPFLAVVASPGSLGLLVTAGLLGIRHGIDWDHIAAITDITSTTATADTVTVAHGDRDRALAEITDAHHHEHGGPSELHAHDLGPGAATLAAIPAAVPAPPRSRLVAEQRHAIRLGTLYALGHASVVAVLGLAALAFGAVLPDWVDPIMGRVVGLTLVVLGVWVFFSLYQYLRYGTEFRLRSRWMLVFDALRIRLAAVRREAPRPRARRAARDDLVRHAHGVRGRDDPRDRRRDGQPGPDHRRGRRRGRRRAGHPDDARVHRRPAHLEHGDRRRVRRPASWRARSASGSTSSSARSAGAFSLVVGALFLFQLEGLLPELDRIFGFIGA